MILRITQEAIVRLIQDTRTAKYRGFIQRSDRDARLEILMVLYSYSKLAQWRVLLVYSLVMMDQK